MSKVYLYLHFLYSILFLYMIYTFIDFILPFEWAKPLFMKNALLAVILAAPLFGTLGTLVVSNQMAFFSDAIGHSVLTGVAIGVLLGIDNPLIAMVAFSLIMGFCILFVKNKEIASADTIIGVFSSTAVALGLVLLSSNGNFSRYARYITGDVLSITSNEIIMLFIANIVLCLVWIFTYNKMILISVNRTFARSRGIAIFAVELLFGLLTAVIVTISISWTGLLVINSLLILPAAAARSISRSSAGYLLASVLISLISSITGLIISFYAGFAAGATIVLVNAVFFVICFFARYKRV